MHGSLAYAPAVGLGSARSRFAAGAAVPAPAAQPSRCRRAPPSPAAVATPAPPPAAATAKRSKVELIKEESDFLRHPLMEELVSEATSINEAAMQLMKFHGSYMQDNRELRQPGKPKHYQFMMRTRQPAGLVSNQLYLTMDTLADRFGNGTLRLTTRECFQLHGVLKENLKTVFSSVIRSMGSTLGACGDVNRNVMAPPVPLNAPAYVAAVQAAEDIAELLAPQSGAYYDVWLDGEKFMSHTMERPGVTAARNDNSFGTNFEGSPEPIYGTQFLPRKFKVAVTVPGDNSVDLFTNDIGAVVISDPETHAVLGYNLYVGGGMGRTHRDEETFPRTADPLGYVPAADLLYAVKAIVCVQRDYGRRDDRKQARLKYLVASWGVDKFRAVAEQYYGKVFEALKPLPPWKLQTYLGWGDQGDGKLYYGIHVASGRIKGEAKRAIRALVERYELPLRITAQQDLILCSIDPAWRADIAATLAAAGVKELEAIDPIDAVAMACPAMPLCGLAVTEAERATPAIAARLRMLLQSVGFPASESFVLRVTGCPNGCARPYMAEVGLVGDGPSSYQLWLGGCPNQTRLAAPFLDRMKLDDLETTLEPILYLFKSRRLTPEETFGDFVHRVGFDLLRRFVAAYKPVPVAAGTLPRVGLDAATFAALQAAAAQQHKTLSELASEAVRAHLKL